MNAPCPGKRTWKGDAEELTPGGRAFPRNLVGHPPTPRKRTTPAIRRLLRAWRPRWIAWVGLAGLLSSCALPMFASPPGPLAYRQGYHDGCASGYAVTGSPFYEPAWEARPPRGEPDYVAGWTAGVYDCGGSFERIQRTIHEVLSPA
jgi:hypothetical protein